MEKITQLFEKYQATFEKAIQIIEAKPEDLVTQNDIMLAVTLIEVGESVFQGDEDTAIALLEQAHALALAVIAEAEGIQ